MVVLSRAPATSARVCSGEKVSSLNELVYFFLSTDICRLNESLPTWFLAGLQSSFGCSTTRGSSLDMARYRFCCWLMLGMRGTLSFPFGARAPSLL